MATISRETLAKLRAFDTPTICNAIELFDVRPRSNGFMDARIKACFDDLPPTVGFAATASFRAGALPRDRDVYTALDAQIERFGDLSGPPIVVFQDLDDPAVAATFGEVMCTAYRAFGAVGLITSGAGRDLDQVRALNFPVFTNGTISAHGYCHTLHVHQPVRVGGLVIEPDDLLHADRNGVTSIPREIADELADAAADVVAAEAGLLTLLRETEPTLASLRAARAEMAAQFAAIRERVSRAH